MITWEDKASNETGYRVYANGALAVTLPENATMYPHTFGVLPAGVPVTYDVEAFNPTGASSRRSIVVTCP